MPGEAAVSRHEGPARLLGGEDMGMDGRQGGGGAHGEGEVMKSDEEQSRAASGNAASAAGVWAHALENLRGAEESRKALEELLSGIGRCSSTRERSGPSLPTRMSRSSSRYLARLASCHCFVSRHRGPGMSEVTSARALMVSVVLLSGLLAFLPVVELTQKHLDASVPVRLLDMRRLSMGTCTTAGTIAQVRMHLSHPIHALNAPLLQPVHGPCVFQSQQRRIDSLQQQLVAAVTAAQDAKASLRVSEQARASLQERLRQVEKELETTSGMPPHPGTIFCCTDSTQ